MSNPIIFYFQPPFTGWMPTSIFQALFDSYAQLYPDKIIANHSIVYNNNCGHKTGPHHLIIQNVDTGFYKVVTYWDRAHEVLNDNCDWNNAKCLGVYSSVDSKVYNEITSASYCVYNQNIEDLIQNSNTDFEYKTEDSLCFRGFLYTTRLSAKENLDQFPNNDINVYSNRISYKEYVEEINIHKIGLSFNGAAEICNRDIEILGVGSVLLRPELVTTNFYNSLIPNFHYIPFEVVSDPKLQTEIIMSKRNDLLQDYEYMRYVANNGKAWYNENGSKEGNVSVLMKTINIEELL